MNQEAEEGVLRNRTNQELTELCKPPDLAAGEGRSGVIRINHAGVGKEVEE
jgi:hypothetical protein